MPKITPSLRIPIVAKNEEQKNMLRTISENHITFATGLAGSGKTFLAVGMGLQMLLQNKCSQLVFTRPVVEAGGEKLGFLPGNLYEKIDPYMIPIFETLSKLLPSEVLTRWLPKTNGNGNGCQTPVRILPLAYMRGISFIKSFIICDESQNIGSDQMRMLLTRLGEGSKMVLCGDVNQSDLGRRNGLSEAFELLSGIDGIGFVYLSQQAIVRHPIIEKIEERYMGKQYTKNTMVKMV